MASLEELRAERVKKLKVLKEKGINPYPIFSAREYEIAEVIVKFKTFEKKKKPITLAGRVVALRPQGALVFLNFTDGTGMLQAMIKKGDMDEESFALFVDTVDIGDFIEFVGSVFVTKREEKTILVKKWRMLAKSLRPLPDKWAGLSDVEERFRKRYLDTLMSSDVKERFILRSRIITDIRDFLNKEEYLEVETAMLQQHAGGATALPFSTHHNALDTNLYLRVAPELYLKRLLAGGFPKVYEIGRNFRNEGIDVTHNPEFTMLEFYESYGDARTAMATVERLLRHTAKNVFKKTNITHNGHTIDFSKKFVVVSYFDLLKQYAHISDPMGMTRDETALSAKRLGIDVARSDSREKIFDNIYKKTCRPKLINPTFIVDYPAHMLPLAKRAESGSEFVDAFQLVAGGIELAKGFSELNDPIDQAERFKRQDEDRKAGDAEAQTSDTAFLEAMEHGMPPAGGVGIGIERLVMFLTDTRNIREVILFPTLRPKE